MFLFCIGTHELCSRSWLRAKEEDSHPSIEIKMQFSCPGSIGDAFSVTRIPEEPQESTYKRVSSTPLRILKWYLIARFLFLQRA